MLVREFLGFEKAAGDVGLELEVEAEKALPARGLPKPWLPHPEGSLRGHAMEYVTDGPIPCDTKKLKYCTELIDTIKPSKPLKDSIRTSFHVHVNMREHTMSELITTACLYWLVDNTMVHYCGPEREGNVFCLRLKDAENVTKQLVRVLDNPRNLNNEFNRNVRYASQNLAALTEHGTLEYRAMRGTLDPEVMDMWSTALFKIGQAGRMHKRPDTMMDRFFAADKKDWLNCILGYPMSRAIRKTNKDWLDMIEENIGPVIEMAYYQDWSLWEKSFNGMPPVQVKKRNRRPEMDMIDDFGIGGEPLRWVDPHPGPAPVAQAGGGGGGGEQAHPDMIRAQDIFDRINRRGR
jgi:hypothetical protein